MRGIDKGYALKSLLLGGAALTVCALAAPAQAGESLTWSGLTFYGTVDVDYSYQNHGAQRNADYGQTVDYLISKNSNTSQAQLASNGLSQSNLGLRGDEALTDNLSLIFKVEGGFNPTSLHLVNGEQSVRSNDNRALSSQTANSDSSRDGQFDNAAGFIGVKNGTYGSLTVGRHTTPLNDDIGAYDPNGGSYAFSLIGFSSTAAAGGSSEDARLDSSIKYNGSYGPVRAALIYQPGGEQYQLGYGEAKGGSAEQASIGLDLYGLSGDVFFAHKNDAVSVSNVTSSAPATGLLSATLSDNTAWGGMLKYNYGKGKIYGGYENITYANPANPFKVGNGLGDYGLSVSSSNLSAYNRNKVLQYAWTGVSYSVLDNLTVTAAYYLLHQGNYWAGNSYSGSSGSGSCSYSGNKYCSGNENVGSLVGVYNLNHHLDLYTGVTYSTIQGGLANGFDHNNAFSETTGVRFSF